MKNLYNLFFNKSNIYIFLIIFFYSFLINFYYAHFGVFPVDTFLHYDSSFRILKNEYPVRDYWIVSGFVLDFIQSIFFKIFGVNWFAYLFHSSIFNFLVSLIIYYYFINLNIEKKFSLFFTCCFSTLAYTVSGTPFVDHHAAFFLLIATIFIINSIKTEKNYIWFFVLLFYFLSFFTKQVPAAYLAIIHGVIILLYILNFKRFTVLKNIILSFISLMIIFFSFLKVLNINLQSFYIQYIDYPQSIGSSRFENLQITLNGFFNDYKYLIFPILLIIFIKFSHFLKKKEVKHKKDLFETSIFFTFVICMVLHQIMTKNQIYIYFLIPITFGLLYSEIKKLNFRYGRYFITTLVVVLFLITLKYHYRYNENRKFHELEKVRFENYLPASKIDKKLKNLKWINPMFKNNVEKEIDLIKKGVLILNNEKNEIMLISHYLFLDSLTSNNLNYPNRTFTTDGASMPNKDNEFYNYYRNFFSGIIKSKKIKKIFFFKHEGISPNTFTDYFDASCYEMIENEVFYIYRFQCSS